MENTNNVSLIKRSRGRPKKVVPANAIADVAPTDSDLIQSSKSTSTPLTALTENETWLIKGVDLIDIRNQFLAAYKDERYSKVFLDYMNVLLNNIELRSLKLMTFDLFHILNQNNVN